MASRSAALQPRYTGLQARERPAPGAALNVVSHRYYRAVDGLRTVCIASVILNHLDCMPPAINRLPFWLGVDLFFLISGFIITTLLLREERENGRIDLAAFYVRRVFRIVPVYALVLATYFLTAAFNPTRWHLMLKYAWYYLTLSGDIMKLLPPSTGANLAPFGSSWSLGIEEKFYFVWPLAFFILAPRRLRAFVLPVLLLAIYPLPHFWMSRSYFGLLLGCALALVIHHEGLPRLKTFLSRLPSAATLLVLGILFYAVSLDWRFTFAFDIAGVLLLASLILSNQWTTRLLAARPMVWLGRRSYSMYLVHTFAIEIVLHVIRIRNPLTLIALPIVSLALSALGAHILYLTVEEPARIFARHWLARRRRTPSSINPAAAVAGTSGTNP